MKRATEVVDVIWLLCAGAFLAMFLLDLRIPDEHVKAVQTGVPMFLVLSAIRIHMWIMELYRD